MRIRLMLGNSCLFQSLFKFLNWGREIGDGDIFKLLKLGTDIRWIKFIQEKDY